MNQLALFTKRRRSYHKTVRVSSHEERVHEAINKKQDAQILQFMKERKRDTGWTSFEIWEKLQEENCFMLEGSVRRALSNNRPLVYKTRERRKGGHKASCAVWQVIKWIEK